MQYFCFMFRYRLTASASQTEPIDHFPIPVQVLVLEIVEQIASLSNQLQQPAPGMMIFLVNLKMLGEVLNPLREDGNLYFW